MLGTCQRINGRPAVKGTPLTAGRRAQRRSAWKTDTWRCHDEGMLAMAEANGEVAVRDPDQLVKQIERTRENLARTIDTLTERVSPANVAKRAMSKVLDQASRPEVQIGAAAVAAVAAVTVTLVVWWRRRG